MSALATLRAVCNSNRGILTQKTMLIQALVEQFGHDQASAIYKQRCKVVKASIGQHVRHSLDHIDRAVVAVQSDSSGSSNMIHYDMRQRGRADESELDAAMDRIRKVDSLIQEIMQKSYDDKRNPAYHSVDAYFMLSGDEATEYALPSTVVRELAFAAHHAIHHLALIRIISESDAVALDLPVDFGKAPSTLNFHKMH